MYLLVAQPLSHFRACSLTLVTENCGVPSGMPARTIAARIKAVVKNFGEIVKFNAYGDPRQNRLEVRQEEFREAGKWLTIFVDVSQSLCPRRSLCYRDTS